MQLVRRGYPTKVVLDGRHIRSDGLSYVLDTESRSNAPGAASEKIRSLLAHLPPEGFDYWIKKVDSTLRGNVAEETRAVDEVFQSQLLVFMPALPDLGRTTVEGIHYLKGVRITETELARDPKTPVTQDCLPQLLGTAFDEPVGSITLGEIRAGNISFHSGRIFCCDAETNQDMQRVIAAALATQKRVLWVGTAAIADNLLAQKTTVPPALGAVASVSSTTRRQVHQAAQTTPVVQVPVSDLLFGGQSSARRVDEVVSLLEQGQDVLMISDATWSRDRLDAAIAAGRAAGLDAVAVGERAQRLMGELVGAVLERTAVSGLFLAGGDTAMGVFETLGAEGSQITGEVLVGIPQMRLCGGAYDGLRVITKAGAFGGEEAIAFCLRKLKEAEA